MTVPFHKGMFAVFLLGIVVSAAADEPGRHWSDAFDLEPSSIGSLKVHYSVGLAEVWPAVQKGLAEVVDDGEGNRPIYEQIATLKPAFLREAGQLIGEGGLSVDAKNEIFDFFIQAGGAVLPISQTTLILLPKEEVKERLREGYEIPNFEYNREEDVVAFEFHFHRSSETPVPGAQTLFMPVDPDDPSEMLDVVGRVLGSGNAMLGLWLALHEVVEADLVSRLQPRHGFFRWFSDGAADSITALILHRHFPEDTLKEVKRDIAQYEHVKGELNLRYWLPESRQIETPLESEEEVKMARYAYSQFEITRLIQEHGENVIRRILDLAEIQSQEPASLVDAVEEATGTDMRSRLSAYELFSSPEDGIELNQRRFNEATQAKEYEQALTALLRAHELLMYHHGEFQAPPYFWAVQTLRMMGYEEAGDAVLEKLAENAPAEHRTHLRMALIIRAWEMQMPLLTTSLARKLLEEDDRNIPGLSVVLAARMHDQQFEQAESIANAILQHDDGSRGEFFRDIARTSLRRIEEALAADPDERL